MAVWLVFAETIIGQVDAPHRGAAQALAARQYGDQPIARLQSMASYEVGVEERRVAIQRHRLPVPDAPAA